LAGLTAAKSDETATVGQGGCYRRIRDAAKVLTKGREVEKQNGEAAVRLINEAGSVNRPTSGGTLGTLINVKG
jgi:hypothetical protein